MDRDGYQKIPRSFRKYGCKSFHDISVSKGGKKQTYCVANSYVADLSAVNFDDVKKGLYSSLCKRCGHIPCSVDALYFSGQNVYAVEFKTGKVDVTGVVRKLYDSVMCFIEYAGKDFKWARERMSAIVVAAKGAIEKDRASRKAKMPKAQRIFSRASFYQHNPGIGEGRVQLWGLGNLEGVLLSSVYTLSPEEFNAFAERAEWQ